MRVLQVLGESTGGIGHHVHFLCGLLREEGVELAIVQPETNAHEESFETLYIPLPIPNSISPKGFGTIARLGRRALGFDVVHAHGLKAGAFSTLALRGISTKQRPRLVVTLHNQISGSGFARILGNLLLRIICKYADVVFCVSPDLVARAKAYGARSAKLVPIAVQKLERADGVQTTTRDELHITTGLCFVTVARLAPQKGLDILIDAAKQMKSSDYTWLVIGTGPLREELEEAAQGTQVRLLGGRDDIYELLSMADVVVSTSLWEGQQISLQEAIQIGKPIVATEVGGIPLVIGKAGMLVAPEAQAIAAAMDAVGSDARLRDSLHEASLRQAEELPTSGQMLVRVLEAYGG